MKALRHLALAPFLIASLGLCSCNPKRNDTQIVARIKSPDGKLEAVHAYDIGGGAAVGTSDEVFIVEPEAFPGLTERIFSKECVHGMALSWASNRTLNIAYHISSDIDDSGAMSRPSLFSIFSSGYWTFDKPHHVNVRIFRILEPAGNGC